MKLTQESKFFLGILVATGIVIGLALWYFSKPEETIAIPKETLITSSAHSKGNPQASVYLVEFSDYQCPSCKAFAPVVDELTQKYNDSLHFVYRHFPLPKHVFSKPAAYAAEAAGKQGKFWEMTALLFENQERLSDTIFTSLAQTLTLDSKQFENDRKAAETIAVVESDLNLATTLNLPGTPTFFLDGVMLTTLYSPQDLVKAVEKAINK